MTVKGYTTKYLVADAIGTHDGVMPVQAIDSWIEAAEAWIDKRTGRSWVVPTIVGEQQTFTRRDGIVTLNVRPVTAVSAVRARAQFVGATVTLVAATDYELIDAARGRLLVSLTWHRHRLSIDYTATAPVPMDIQLAATKLVVYWIQPMLGSGGAASSASAMDPATLRAAGIKSYSIGQDLSVTFQDSASSGSSGSRVMPAPLEVLQLVDQYRTGVFVT